MRHRSVDSSGRGPGAFTLVEVIVAVGVLAVIGVVIGTIFATIGETVTQGRRVSDMNRFAARIERVMRRDFEHMVRENGFLVIRNELTHDFTNSPSKMDVGLTVTDPAPRPRRIDEIMFFSRGDFTSNRTPLHREMVARSDVARIYYGHGQKMPVDYGSDPSRPDMTTRYARPRLDEPNSLINGRDARLGVPSALGTVNPNEFASDWSLLRHVTLLVPRPGGLQELPDDVFGLRPNDGAPEAYYRVADSSRQVALGPAAQSVFRAVSAMVPYEINTLSNNGGAFTLIDPVRFNIRPFSSGYSVLLGGSDETRARPLFTSGLVDVAVTDLDEIRAVVTSPWLGSTNNASERLPRQLTPYDYSSTIDRLTAYEQQRVLFDNSGRPRVGSVLSTGLLPMGAQRQAQQVWMLDALPSTPFDPQSPADTGMRVRYEDAPPRVFSESAVLLTTSDADKEIRMNRAVEQADQEMLGASVFLPRCTEFIVEWSLGIIDRRNPDRNPNYGQPIWYGLRRYRDGNGNGRYDEGGANADTPDKLYADFFNTEVYDGTPLLDRSDRVDDDFGIRGVLGDWFFEDGNAPQRGLVGESIDLEMQELIRVDRRFDPSAVSNVEDAVGAEYCFGYVYQDQNNPGDPDDDVVRPWPWPRLIRVTMRFVDPSDLENERTYQVIFRVPDAAGEM